MSDESNCNQQSMGRNAVDTLEKTKNAHLRLDIGSLSYETLIDALIFCALVSERNGSMINFCSQKLG